MEDITAASSTIIPTIDLSPFLEGGDEHSKKKVIKTIHEAITKLGVFEIQNHGVALENCEKLLELTKEFFAKSDEEKKAATAEDLEMAGTGYAKLSDGKYYDYEYLLMYPPDKQFNGVPTIQEGYKETFEEVFNYYVKISQILEGIINDGLGLPSNFLTTYNNDRCWDFMFPMHYTLSDDIDKLGIVEHEDPNMFTIILQDPTCGLEFFFDGVWIPIIPQKGKLIVIVSDLLKALGNKKIRNVTHRAIKNKENKRLAIDFVYNVGPNKWVEPLYEHSKKLGHKPIYRGFCHKEYIDLITGNYVNPPPNRKDFVDLSYYEIKE